MHVIKNFASLSQKFKMAANRHFDIENSP